jgi:hypothetical protein
MLVLFTVSPALKLGPPFPAIRDCVSNISAVANQKVLTLFVTGNLVVYIIITIIIIMVSCHRTFLLGTSPSWTNGGSHGQRLKFQKFQTAERSVLCVMFLVQLSFVASTFFFKHFVTNPVAQIITTFFASLHANSCILDSFLLPFARYFCPLVLPNLSDAYFLFLVFNYYICPIFRNVSMCINITIPSIFIINFRLFSNAI